MKRMNKKGFTIVELVIVIAVIAILAAVLIPTFASIIKKANIAKDTQLVRNLNTALAANTVEEKTMTDALAAAAAFGYDVGKINASATDNKILWDSTNNVFCYLDGAELKYIPDSTTGAPLTDPDSYKLWEISDTIPALDAQTRSIYAGSNFNVANVALKGIGFDAGNNSGITEVNYTGASSAREVVIRTNGGTLTIDAKTDTVHHYDDLDNLTVTAVDPTNSYHEHGKVKVSAVIKDGHFVIEENGYANELVIPESATAVTVDIKPQGTVVTAIVDNAAATVAIDAGATVGQIVAEDTSKISGAGATEAKENAVTKTEVATAEELKAAVTAGNKYVSITADITLPAWDSENNVGVAVLSDLILDGNNHTLTISAGRGIWIDADNVALTVKNMKMVGASSAFQRAIQVCGGCKGAQLSIDNFEVTNASYYAINICNDCDVDLMITNSKITGWGAVNLWSANYKVYISNCELTGINDKSYNAEGWNDFGTIILEGDTTQQTTDHSSTIDVEIVNTKITATQTKGNRQYCILFNTGCTSNNVKLTGCTLVYNESESTYKLLDQGEGNSLYIDGVKVN